jgi:glycosyl transferase, family 25
MIAVPTDANAPDRTIACYVINMARDVERRERMEVLLGGLGLNFLIVDAVVGASLTPDDLAIFEHRNAMLLLPAELGCMMSHINCWRAFLESGADLALVCEDDIHVSPHIRDCLAAIRFPEDGNVIVRLEGFGSFTTFRVNPIQRIGDYGVHKMLSDHGGTAGYLIDKRAARHLLASAPKFRSAIDIEMFFPKRTTICDVNLYQFIPALFIQDQILTANQSAGFLQSHMGKERADVAIWNNRSVFQRLKGKARPFYQVLYSLYLRLFAGCMRIIVPFK